MKEIRGCSSIFGIQQKKWQLFANQVALMDSDHLLGLIAKQISLI